MFERSSGRILLLSEAHGKKKLLGLAAHPTKPDIFATVGDDAFVRVRNGRTEGAKGAERVI